MNRRLARGCALGSILGALISGGRAVAVPGETVIAREAAVFEADAYADAVAWSSFDPGARRYRLRILRGGQPVPVPVPPQRKPFEVSLGPDRAGRATAVYSRCREDARRRGCDIHALRLGARRATPVPGAHRPGVDERLPAIWRGQVAFSRRTRTASTLATVTPSGRVTRRGSLRFEETGGLSSPAQPERLSLRGDRLVVSASSSSSFCEEAGESRKEEPRRTGIFVVRMDRGTRRLLDEGCEDDPTESVDDAQLAAGRIFYLRSRRPADTVLREVTPSGRLVRETPLGEATASYAIADRARYEVRYDADAGSRPDGRPWRLVRTR